LALAQSQLGQHAEAVATLQRKEQLCRGLYPTQANLGRVLMRAGKYTEALPHLELAAEWNTRDRNGRDFYQMHLCAYILSRQKDGEPKLPLTRIVAGESDGFAGYLKQHIPMKFDAWRSFRREEAILALQQMLADDHTSAILLEAIANVLDDAEGEPLKSSVFQASQAYLRAGHLVADAEARQGYRSLARESFNRLGRDQGFDDFEEQFQASIAEADAKFAKLQTKEVAAIRAGQNPEQELAKTNEQPRQTTAAHVSLMQLLTIVAGLAALFFGFAYLGVKPVEVLPEDRAHE
jgi:tetratricopeptide (TPR) repeat protein